MKKDRCWISLKKTNILTQVNYLPTRKKYVIILLLHTGVNFVPTFLTKGRIDSAIFEVYLPIAKTIASRKRMYQGVHPPAEYQQVTKSTCVKFYFVYV